MPIAKFIALFFTAIQGRHGKGLAIGIASIAGFVWMIRTDYSKDRKSTVVPKNARPFRMNHVGLFYVYSSHLRSL